MARGNLINWPVIEPKLMELWNQGLTREVIAVRLGISFHAVDARLAVLRKDGRIPPAKRVAPPSGPLPKTIVEARESGIAWYYTGEPCQRGHYAPRALGDSQCLECRRERKRGSFPTTKAVSPRACIGIGCLHKPMESRLFLSADPPNKNKICPNCAGMIARLAA